MKLTNKEFIRNIEKKYTFEKNPSVAVAVSGGADSMSLLFLVNAFIKYKKGNLMALIVDHRIRKNSNQEAKYISTYLKKNNITSQILTVNKINVSILIGKTSPINKWKICFDELTNKKYVKVLLKPNE